MKPQLPLRQELENASHTFEKYKSKISSFFINSKKLENLTKKMSTTSELSGLNKLVPDYDDDEEDQDNKNEHDEKSSTNNLNTENENDVKTPAPNDEVVVTASSENEQTTMAPKNDESDEEDNFDDICETDLEKQCDLEIVTTSELKSNMYGRRNYVPPSLKASYFPLKASRDYSCVLDNQMMTMTIKSNELIGSEKSTGALTVMGSIGSIFGNQQQTVRSNGGSSSSSLAQILFGRR